MKRHIFCKIQHEQPIHEPGILFNVIVHRTEQLRIGLTDVNFPTMLHLNPMKAGSKTEREISHMENFLNDSVFMLRP